MSPSDRDEVALLLERLRAVDVPGVDNVAAIVKERDALYNFVQVQADLGDASARAVLVKVSSPLPHRF